MLVCKNNADRKTGLIQFTMRKKETTQRVATQTSTQDKSLGEEIQVAVIAITLNVSLERVRVTSIAVEIVSVVRILVVYTLVGRQLSYAYS